MSLFVVLVICNVADNLQLVVICASVHPQSALEATQGQILSQSPTDATSGR